METKILIAEDEENIRRLVTSYLINEGYRVISAVDGQDAINKFDDNPDLTMVILDVMMPKMDGFEVCKYIRENSEIPIMMLTARDTEADELTGFSYGADEYISKPFSPAILITRIKNTLKRYAADLGQDIELDGVKIVFREKIVVIDGKKVILTPKEFELLHYLMQNKNIVLSREQILMTVWGYDYGGEDRTVDTHIKCLRAKMGEHGKKIATVRKFGYKYEY